MPRHLFRSTFVLVAVLALVGAFAGGLSLRDTAAQDTAAAMAGHPIVGTWLALVPQAPGDPAVASPSLYTADGRVVLGWPVSQAGPQGVVFHSGWVGSWEPTGERSIQFTAVQVLSDANGAYLGTATVHGHPMVSEDGQTFVDADPASTITIRDPAGNVVTVLSGGPPVTATRIGVASDGFPPATPAAATPTA